MRTNFARFTLASLTMATTLSVASCGQVPAQRAADAPASGVRSGALWNEPQFTTMLQAYRRKLPGKCRALRFEMTESGASLEVQDSAEPANVVSYDYKGAVLSGPSPVDLAGVLEYSNLADELFDWDQVAVERIPTLVKAALSRTKLAGSQGGAGQDHAQGAHLCRASPGESKRISMRSLKRRKRRCMRVSEQWNRNSVRLTRRSGAGTRRIAAPSLVASREAKRTPTDPCSRRWPSRSASDCRFSGVSPGSQPTPAARSPAAASKSRGRLTRGAACRTGAERQDSTIEKLGPSVSAAHLGSASLTRTPAGATASFATPPSLVP